MIEISPYLNPCLKLLLNGDPNSPPEINNTIILKVQKYIIDAHFIHWLGAYSTRVPLSRSV